MGNYQSLAFWSLVAVNQVSRFCVPAFFILVGFFTTYGKPNSFSTRTDINSNIKNRLTRILPPYLTWSLILYVLPLMFNGSLKPGALVLDLLMGSTFTGGYFIVVLAQLTIIGPWLVYYTRRIARLPYLVIILSLVISQLIFIVGAYGNSYLSYLIRVGFVYFSASFLPWISFFTLGLLYGSNFDSWTLKLRSKTTFLALSAIPLLLLSIFEFTAILYKNGSPGMAASYFKPSSMLFALLLCGIVATIKHGSSRLIPVWKFISDGSFPIYLLHGIILQYLLNANYFKQFLLAGQILLILAGTIVPLLVYYFSIRYAPDQVQLILFGSVSTKATKALKINELRIHNEP